MKNNKICFVWSTFNVNPIPAKIDRADLQQVIFWGSGLSELGN